MPLRVGINGGESRVSDDPEENRCWGGRCQTDPGTGSMLHCQRHELELQELAESEVVQCPQCGGQAEPIGQLGQLAHFRCRQCGMDHHRPAGAR